MPRSSAAMSPATGAALLLRGTRDSAADGWLAVLGDELDVADDMAVEILKLVRWD
jgi:hypothetical protein